MMKYRIGLTADARGAKELYIETDDISELGSINWVRDFLYPRPLQQASVHVDDAELRQLRSDNEAMQQAIVQLRQMIQQQQSVQQPQQPQQPRQPVQQQQSVQPRGPGKLPTSYLELNPDAMTGDIWNSLTEDQRVAWMKQWNIQ